MLYSAKKMHGFTMLACDGEVGKIEDLYFDDEKWTIRHLAVDTGGWLSGREVLLSPFAVEKIDAALRQVHTRLTRQQIEGSPGIDTSQPVSRRHETELYRHYGYPAYWTGPYLWGYTMLPALLEETPLEDPERRALRERMEQEDADFHLRSCREVTGYHIQTADDDSIGHVEDFLFDDENWSIQLMVVDTRNWWPGKHVLVSPRRVERVDWHEMSVMVKATRDEVEHSPEYDSTKPPGDGGPNDLYRHPGRPLDLP